MNGTLHHSVGYTAYHRGFSAMTVVGVGFVVISTVMLVGGIHNGVSSPMLVGVPLVAAGVGMVVVETRRRGQLVLRADARGLELGADHDVLIPWAAVVDLRVRGHLSQHGARLCIRFDPGAVARPGTRPRTSPAVVRPVWSRHDGPVEAELDVDLRGWRFDRPALYAAVRTFAPHAQVRFGGGPPGPPFPPAR